MASYEFRYVGADSLPNRLSEFEVQQHFRLSNADVAALNERFRIDRRAGAAILLLFMRAAGRPLDRFTTLPKALLQRVGEALGVRVPTIATLRSIYARRQTLYEHQLWLKGYLGLTDVDQAASDQLVEHLNACAREVVSIDELVVAANRWLYDRKFVIAPTARFATSHASATRGSRLRFLSRSGRQSRRRHSRRSPLVRGERSGER